MCFKIRGRAPIMYPPTGSDSAYTWMNGIYHLKIYSLIYPLRPFFLLCLLIHPTLPFYSYLSFSPPFSLLLCLSVNYHPTSPICLSPHSFLPLITSCFFTPSPPPPPNIYIFFNTCLATFIRNLIALYFYPLFTSHHNNRIRWHTRFRHITTHFWRHNRPRPRGRRIIQSA